MKKILLSFGLLLFFCISSAQAFRFNSDGTSNAVTFTSDKTAHELFEETLSWVYKNYDSYLSKSIIDQTKHDKLILLNTGISNAVFDEAAPPQKYFGKQGYYASVSITIQFQDGSYTVQFDHKKFIRSGHPDTDVVMLPEVLAAADTKRWKGAKEQYEKKVNDIYFRIYQYVENGVLLPEPNPYAEETFESFSQEAHFNPDGSIPAISYRVDKTAPELYYYTLQWMKEYYIKPELVVKESHKNQSIILESGCGSALFPNTQKLNALDKLGFSGKFDMKIEFQDGQYTVTYIHLNFADSGGEKVNINFSEVFANTKITEEGNGRDLKFQGIRTYEKKVNQLLTSLNHYLITTEFISQ